MFEDRSVTVFLPGDKEKFILDNVPYTLTANRLITHLRNNVDIPLPEEFYLKVSNKKIEEDDLILEDSVHIVALPTITELKNRCITMFIAFHVIPIYMILHKANAFNIFISHLLGAILFTIYINLQNSDFADLTKDFNRNKVLEFMSLFVDAMKPSFRLEQIVLTK